MAVERQELPFFRPELRLQPELENRSRTLRELMPTELRPSFLDIDFRSWTEKGVNTLLLDAEGTVVATDLWDIDQQILQKVQEAREAGIENIAIVSNKVPKNEASFLKLTWWAHQLGADRVFVPQKGSERKPSPLMLLKALTYFGVKPEQAMVAGDKATADILAANRAGIRSVLVNKLRDEEDDRDLIGDKVFRDPIENLLRGVFRRVDEKTGLPKEPAHVPVADFFDAPIYPLEPAGQKEKSHPRGWDPSDTLAQIRGEAQVVSGYGAPDVVLSPHIKALVPHSYHGMNRGIQELRAHPLYEAAGQRLVRHFEKHGRLEADILTVVVRPALTGLSAYYLAKRNYKAAAVCDVLASLTDMEGRIVKYDPKQTSSLMELVSRILGRDVDGAFLDPLIDKVQSVVLSTMLTYLGLQPKRDFAIQTWREFRTTKKRKEKSERGVDTRAIWSGKGSTVLVDAIRPTSMLTGEQHPVAGNVLWTVGSTAKVGSMYHSEGAWEKLHEWRLSDAERAKEVIETLRVDDNEAA